MKKYADEAFVDDRCLDLSHPVGSVYISTTNTNPSGLFGGSWTLIHKSFASASGNGTTVLFTPSSNVSSGTVYYSRSGQSLFLRVGLTTSVQIKDSTTLLGTLNLQALGVSALPFGLPVYCGCSDGGGAVMMITTDAAGTMNAVEVVSKTDGTLTADSTVYAYYTYVLPHDLMLDGFCDEFHWKRTA